MASQGDKAVKDVEKTTLQYLTAWGSEFIYCIRIFIVFCTQTDMQTILESPLPPTLLATFATALHFRPFRPVPMLFPPVLLFSTYLNLSGYETDAAGVTAAWSGLYLLLASRRKPNSVGGFTAKLGSKYGARGLTRGVAMALAAANVVGGGVAYTFGKRKDEKVI